MFIGLPADFQLPETEILPARNIPKLHPNMPEMSFWLGDTVCHVFNKDEKGVVGQIKWTRDMTTINIKTEQGNILNNKNSFAWTLVAEGEKELAPIKPLDFWFPNAWMEAGPGTLELEAITLDENGLYFWTIGFALSESDGRRCIYALPGDNNATIK